jgi:outer membrane lipoprotein carrier protein
MSPLKYLSFFLILCFSSQNTFGQVEKLENSEEWVNKINEQTKEIKSLQADFMQQKVLSFLEEPVQSSGQFWFNEPNKIRWEYTSPYHYTMIMNSGLLTVKDGGDEFSSDLSSNQMFEQMTSLITGSIQGKLLSDEANYLKEYFQNEEEIIVRFIPKDSELAAYLDYMEIWFSKKTLEVDVLLMHESSGDYTKMIFTNTVRNQNISKDVFE